jgi:hypothetical protein
VHRRMLLVCGVVMAAAAIAPAGALAWAPAATAPVHPGVQLLTNGAQCTANFIYSDGANTYIGQAAHCSGTGAATSTNGCDSASLPEGTPVEITGASKPGVMVYNSWIRMQAAGETDADTCAYNDLALIKLDPADAANVDPSVPGFGGPTGLASLPAAAGSTVYTYGNSSLRGGVTKLSPKQGTVVQEQGAGWSRDVYTVTPGIPGDSGSGFMDASGRAIGVLSTVQIAPLAASNGVGNLSKEVAYAQAHGFGGLSLVTGGPFNGSVVTAILGA